MFSQGQLIFGVLFFIAFAIFIGFSYRKDLKLHKKYYKGSLWILLGFITFVIVLFFLKSWLQN